MTDCPSETLTTPEYVDVACLHTELIDRKTCWRMGITFAPGDRVIVLDRCLTGDEEGYATVLTPDGSVGLMHKDAIKRQLFDAGTADRSQ